MELHVHGGAAVRAAMLEALQCIPSLRMAEPGEFTKRAFEVGLHHLSGEADGCALIAVGTHPELTQ